MYNMCVCIRMIHVGISKTSNLGSVTRGVCVRVRGSPKSCWRGKYDCINTRWRQYLQRRSTTRMDFRPCTPTTRHIITIISIWHENVCHTPVLLCEYVLRAYACVRPTPGRRGCGEGVGRETNERGSYSEISVRVSRDDPFRHRLHAY